ncbi:metallophosphoesterase family protein [Gimesia algae]|uniref:Serine/threonine-protein phosphatase 1 n=1 Tax=Gimesia algae TaxID=2527971 RepID=A0A517VAX4_9PLAN|nr:metallophosphoesterase family protein [Gimesia algae]QDT90161.1 Serine/threonine-protein phosphatase 1 [Gimesia algae]
MGEGKQSGRLIAIGDIHGHNLALQALLEQIVPVEDDTIVILGDYINRGPDSCGVIETLLELHEQCQLIPILGNHEEMMLDSRDDCHAEQRWMYQGGKATLESYGDNAGIGQISQTHWRFLSECRPYYETENFIFTHANYCWYSALDQQPSSLLRWLSLKESEPRPHVSGKTVILGHTPGVIRDYGFCRCIDTGCGFGGQLTAMDVASNTSWQVTESGEVVASDHS